MHDDPDPDLEQLFAAQVSRGQFATAEQARADFDAGMERAMDDIDAGRTEDIDGVRARMHERFANWPRAAE